ncbi:exodeoxyribonuclease VII small subunit [Kamptonema formosum]|uniref:exodeoxyribonuclease VII small subunit n=1 Tax=Kamptonema formosum TaxID=331992 RepID=UPI000346F068|nr:exodeoxyribonuclease VII small subunit [Oscillatoria sp. PCC 10802]
MNALSFEEQIDRLEEIVGILDKGEAPIEEMLKLYEEGMGLARFCRTYLESAEQKVIVISRQDIESGL